MSFVRPEAQEQIWRWREAIAGAAIALLGAYFIVIGLGFVVFLGVAFLIVGLGLSIAGWQRARFRVGRGGAGIVTITEHQVTYFGPFTGGTVAIESILQVSLNPLPRSGPVWELDRAGDIPLRIPANAEGAEGLFDVFGTLPGLQVETMLATVENPGDAPVVIWTRRLLH